TELNFIRDDFFHASAGGVATYLTYALNDQLSIGGRAEVFRDDQGFFVAAFPSSNDFLNCPGGPAQSVILRRQDDLWRAYLGRELQAARHPQDVRWPGHPPGVPLGPGAS